MSEAWSPVADHVLARLSEAIMSGELAPGAKISEPELAKLYGVSRAPLREAIRRLEERSLVTRVPRQSARVVALTPERIREVFVIREAIEGMAAREAATRITGEEIARLQAGLERQRAATSESGAYPFESLDTDYHEAIAQATRNQFLVNLRADYQLLVEIGRRRQRASPERARQSLLEHQRIVEALAARDPDLAEMLMRRHVAAAREHLLQHLPATTTTKEKTR